MEILGIIVLLSIIGIIYNPKLDKTVEGDLLLWYGKKDNRKYIKL